MGEYIGSGSQPLVDSGVAFPTPPPGSEVVTEWLYGDLENLPDGADLVGLGWDSYSIAQIPVEEWYRQFDAVKEQLGYRSGLEWDLMGFAVYESPVGEVEIPREFCVLSDAFCIAVPQQICVPCLPWQDCLNTPQQCFNLAGETYTGAYKYHIWLMIWPHMPSRPGAFALVAPDVAQLPGESVPPTILDQMVGVIRWYESLLVAVWGPIFGFLGIKLPSATYIEKKTNPTTPPATPAQSTYAGKVAPVLPKVGENKGTNANAATPQQVPGKLPNTPVGQTTPPPPSGITSNLWLMIGAGLLVGGGIALAVNASKQG